MTAELLRAIPLTSGPVPVALGVLALASLIVAVGPRPRTAALAAGVAVATVTTARLAVPGWVDVARVPQSFYAWALLPPFAVTVAVTVWRHGARRRAAALLSIATAVAFGAAQVNAWFAYLPTAADLAGLPVPLEAGPGRMPPSAVRTGAVMRVDVPATTSGFHHRGALVYLPPAALAGGHEHLGVVMMLAGTPGAPDDLLRAGRSAAIASRYAAAHGGRSPILVFPDHNGSFGGDTECVDSRRGNAETYLTVDVPRFVSTTFGVAAGGWGIFGYSEGGTCAVTLALRHPTLFPAFVDIAGDPMPNLGTGRAGHNRTLRALFAGDERDMSGHDPRALLAQGRYPQVAGWFAAGTGDRPARRSVALLAPAAAAAGAEVHQVTLPGHHSFGLVNRATPAAFGWLADRTDGPPAAGGP